MPVFVVARWTGNTFYLRVASLFRPFLPALALIRIKLSPGRSVGENPGSGRGEGGERAGRGRGGRDPPVCYDIQVALCKHTPTRGQGESRTTHVTQDGQHRLGTYGTPYVFQRRKTDWTTRN